MLDFAYRGMSERAKKEFEALDSSAVASTSAIDAVDTIVGDGLDVSTVKCTSVVAGDELTVTVGGQATTFTAVANDATPTATQFKIGTTDAGCATNLAALIVGIDGLTVTRSGDTITVKTPSIVTLAASSDDDAKLVCTNHKEVDLYGNHTERIACLLVALSALDARVTAVENA